MMEGAGAAKQALRERVWALLEERGVALFPGAFGRIPNFRGREEAARRLRQLPLWREARVLKCNPDAPQLPLRRAALEEGKVVYMAVPRLRQLACFLELDPRRLGPRALQAATIGGAFRYGRPVHPWEMPTIDLVVCGSVAVNLQGARVGKGGGYSDLEWAMVAQLGKITPRTVVVTTVHPLQVVEDEIPMLPHDIPVDYVATPAGVLKCAGTHARPQGIYWELLPPEKLAAVPALQALVERGA